MPVDFPGGVSAEKELAELKQAVSEAAAMLSRGEISAAGFDDQLKLLMASTRNLEQAIRATNAAIDSQVDAIGEQITEELRAAKAVQALGATRANSAQSSEMTAMTLQPETEMITQGALPPAELKTAEDAELASLQRSLAVKEASRQESAQTAGALAREAAERSGLTAAEDVELASLGRSIAAQDAAEQKAIQLAEAEAKAANALQAVDGVMENFTADCSAAASAQAKLGTAAGTLRGDMGNLQQSIIAGSCAFQGFTATSGDMGAKLNSLTDNLPSLSIGVGGLGVALSAAGTAAKAVYKNWDSIASLREDRNPFPKLAGDIDGMKRELDAANDSIKKFEKPGHRSTAQFAIDNELRETQARWEKGIADQQKRQDPLKKLSEAIGDEQEGRAKGLQEAARRTDSGGSLRQARENDGANTIEPERVGMALRIDAIQASNKSDEEKARLGTKEAARDSATSRGVNDPANDSAKLTEDRHVLPGKGEEAGFTALNRPINETGVLFGDLKKQVEIKNPVLKQASEDWFDAELKALKNNIRDTEKRHNAERIADDRPIDAWAKPGKNAEVKEFEAEEDVLAVDIREPGKRQKAVGERIQASAGKDANEIITERVAANPPDDLEKLAARITAGLVTALSRIGTPQSSAQLAGQTDYRLTDQKIGRAPLAAIRQIRTPRRGAVRVNRPQPGKRPPPKPDPKIVTKPAPPKRNPPHALTEAEIAARRKDQQPKSPGPQASIASAVQGTQGALDATQAAQARDQQIVAALNARVRQLEANARLLNNRAREQGPSASNTGSSVA